MSKYVVVCSDNHGDRDSIRALINYYPDALAYLHCGDVELPREDLKEYHVIAGNNDYFHKYPEHLFLTIEDVRIGLIHGHQMSFFNRDQDLKTYAKNHQLDLLCFGHTHIFTEIRDGHRLILNPGSLSYNRDNSDPSYALVYLESDQLRVERKKVLELFKK